MAQKKAHEVEAWLRRPPENVSIVLIYGPDRGLVSERAKAFAEKTGLPLDDPFSVVRLDAGEAERDQGRLLDEARTVPMFSARRLLWVRNAGAQKSLGRRRQGAVGRAAARRGDPDRGRRPEEGRGAALGGRGERHRHGAALLWRRGPRHRRRHRRRTRQDRHGHRDGGARRAAPQSRRRPAGDARRDRQARALRARQARDRTGGRARHDRRRLGPFGRRRGRCDARRQDRRFRPDVLRASRSAAARPIWCWRRRSGRCRRCI